MTVHGLAVITQCPQPAGNVPVCQTPPRPVQVVTDCPSPARASTRSAVVAPEHSLLSPQATACTEQICMGSVMTPSPHIRKSEDTRTKEEVLLLAKDFIDQYYSSIKR